MYYINSTPNEKGNHGNPTTIFESGMVSLPTYLVSDYLSAKGFVHVTIESDVATSITVNQEALDAYEAALPETPPQPEPMTQDEIETMLFDQEYRLLLLEYGLEEEEPV